MNTNKFDIKLYIKQPTNKLLMNTFFMLDYNQVAKEANMFKKFLLELFSEKIDFSSIPEKEVLIVNIKRDGRRVMKYSSIKNSKVRRMVKMVVEEYNERRGRR